MAYQTTLRRGNGAVFSLHIHVVFVTKYRKRIFTKLHLDALNDYFKKVCASFEASLVEFNGEKDHVHLLRTLWKGALW